MICPICEQWNKDKTIKCVFCGSNLRGAKDPTAAPVKNEINESADWVKHRIHQHRFREYLEGLDRSRYGDWSELMKKVWRKEFLFPAFLVFVCLISLCKHC